MIPVAPTDRQAAAWAAADGCQQHVAVIGGPEEGDGVIPCPTLVSDHAGRAMCHVAYQLDELEVAALAHGATLWLTTWGGLPVHHLTVGDPL